VSRESAYLDFRGFDAFYAWLADHHGAEADAHLFIYKKGFRDRGISYEDAVRAALCWGWIDSVTRRYDEARFTQRFSPRKPASNWSASNVRRMIELMDGGQVTDAGMAVFDEALIEQLPAIEAAERARREEVLELTEASRAIMAEDPRTLELFDQLAPSHRRQYLQWIRHAKREDTRARRTRKMMEMLLRGRSLSEL